MIEPTDEMIETAGRAFYGERPINPARRAHLRNAVTAALEVVARDYCLEARGHVRRPPARTWPPGRGGKHPHFCVSCSDGVTAGPGCGNCRSTGYDQTPWPNCEGCRS